MIESLKKRVLEGESLDEAEVLSLAAVSPKEALYQAAGEITRHFVSPRFDTCSIVNARSGRCSENCKWCAQSAHYATGISIHGIVSADECLEQARYNEAKGVHRFSLVTSGRSVSGKALEKVCDIYRTVGGQTGMYLCASLGLLTREELQQLYDSGVRRYHCNLETAPSFFSSLCTTHTIDEKLQTIRWAKEIGFEVCSGGIIGMGETLEQRIELAFKLREVTPHSIPINILQPIPGTPLADVPPLSDEEILTTIALFRFVHPKVELRFAGGRARLSHEVLRRAMEIGINSAVVGDLLTTVGTGIDEDRQLSEEAGYVASPAGCRQPSTGKGGKK